MKQFFIILAISILTFSCSTNTIITRNDLMVLKKGLSLDEVKILFNNKVSYKIHTFNDEEYIIANIEILFRSFFEVETETYSVITGYQDPSRYGSSRPIYSYKEKTGYVRKDYNCNYYLVFKNKMLFYWGYEFELYSSFNPILNKLFN